VIRHDCDASNWKFNDPQELFREYRLWVACEADEELPHLVRFLGEDNLIIGSDYGHNDPSKEPQFVANLRTRKDVPARFNREDFVPKCASFLMACEASAQGRHPGSSRGPHHDEWKALDCGERISDR
jgi:hypothetical protein